MRDQKARNRSGLLAQAVRDLTRTFNLPALRELESAITRALDQVPIDFGGGCSLAKARCVGELVRRYNLRTTVDIGVYRGRSHTSRLYSGLSSRPAESWA